MNIPTRDEIRAAYRQGEEVIVQLFERLIQELPAPQDRLNKNLVSPANLRPIALSRPPLIFASIVIFELMR
jgi:hypothetical protein